MAQLQVSVPRRALNWLLDLLYPSKCPFCGHLLQKGESDLCARCQNTLPWLIEQEAEVKGEFFSLCAAPLRYQDTVRDSLHRYKFSGRRGYSRVYGHLMAQCVQDHLVGRFDCITWVPLSAKRRRKRGYDQARLLAEVLGQELKSQPVALLRKCRNNPAQSGIDGGDPSARRANVLGVYEAVRPDRIQGQRILLVDDIVTTGSTLSECARILLTAGAAEVVCVTVARAR